MKPKSFLLLMMALGSGTLAAFGVTQSGKKDVEEKQMVLVAKAEISPYLPLTEEHVEFREYSKEMVPLGAVTTKEEYERRALRSKAFPGTPIVKANLGEKGDFDASTEIPDGYRVYTTPITQTSSHSGQIRPKDRVDIFVTYKDKDGLSRVDSLKTKMILEWIEVFSMGGDRDENSPTNADIIAKNVSMLVTPKQAAILMMAESKGDLHFALRPKNETAATKVELLTEEDFDNLGTAKSVRDELEKAHQGELEKLRLQLADEHSAELAKLKSENQRLLASLSKKVDPETVAEVVKVVEPEVWKIKIVQGGETEESEFVIGEVEKEVPVTVPTKQPTNTSPENQETSSLTPVQEKEEENPMQVLLNRLFEGS
jgi:pilus assembly protein CpaB